MKKFRKLNYFKKIIIEPTIHIEKTNLYTITRTPDLTSIPRRDMVGISRFVQSYAKTL
jgi:hypothetical protein